MSDIKQVIVVRADLKMRRGKESAQVSHASMKVFFDRIKEHDLVFDGESIKVTHLSETPEMKTWRESRFKKVVVSCDSEEELMAINSKVKKAGLIHALIIDSGLTEFRQECPNCKGEGNYPIPTGPPGEDENRATVDITCGQCEGTGKIGVPTRTCLAIGPDHADKIDEITGHLKSR